MNIEHRTSNIEHRTSNIEHRTSNIEHRTSNIEHRRVQIFCFLFPSSSLGTQLCRSSSFGEAVPKP
ncbi:hypothetical protein FDQ92_10270 [Desulfoglaeba alkanexedens ALDC]|uniref:Uncharacterized protein n=1 Tax=Desulfoglaeba alkanexedens ALDC TaxID=980445 RepID=A0A4P8L3Z4_9BACT|nr:hypothetical protein FDQ92_10270 [Desulfoglaeba alkanexedens ALDC]